MVLNYFDRLMEASEKDLVINSPKRKQFGGFWYIASGIGCLAMWGINDKGSGSAILLGVSIALFLLGLHRLLTKSVTFIREGKIPLADKQTLHFGFYKVEESINFDEISLLRRENLLPYCQLYAYASLDYLKTRISPDELKLYETEQKHLPGVVITDHATKKECEELTEKVWRFYGLWQED